MALATRNAESRQRSMSHGGVVESFSGATASAKPPLVKQCIDYVLTMYFYFYGVSICQSTFFISHLFPVFFAKAARQLLQVEHYDAVVEERSLGGALWPSTLQWGRLGGAGTKLGNELPHSFQKASGQLDDVKFLQKMCDFEVCSFHFFSLDRINSFWR